MSLFKVCTAQAMALKTTLDAIVNCHVTEANLVLNSQTGITITEVDPSHAMVIRLLLEKTSFQIFEMADEEYVVGVSMKELARLVKNATNKDTITFTMEREKPEILKIIVYNDFSKSCITHHLKTLLLPYDKITIPYREADRVINLPSGDFARYVKDFSSQKFIELEVTNDHVFYIRVRTDLCTSQAEVRAKTNQRGERVGNGSTCIGIGRKGQLEVCQRFATKFLMSIAKGANLDDQVTIYLSNNEAAMVRYNISIIGSLVYVLAPEEDDEMHDEGTQK